MSKIQHVIYIPGLGDSRPLKQPELLNLWRTSGIIVHYHAVGWATTEPFAAKLKKLEELVDELYKNHGPLSVIGVSAGATAALNLYMSRKDKIRRVVYICGKLLGVSNVSKHYFMQNPAFYDSLVLAQSNIEKLDDEDKQKMLSVHAIYDNVVPLHTSLIPGVRAKTLPSILHIPSIFLAISIYRSMTINFLKQKTIYE